MADNGDDVEHAIVEIDHLDWERRSLAAIDGAHACIRADVAAIVDAEAGAVRSKLLDATLPRVAAMQAMLAAFEPLATMLSAAHGRVGLRTRIEEVGSNVALHAKLAKFYAALERIVAEFFANKTSRPALLDIERRLTVVDFAAAALERDGEEHPRIYLSSVRDAVRQQMRDLLMQRHSAPQPQPQPAPDPKEAAELRAIQRAIDADNRATSMKIFEIQRQAQQDAHESMQRIHDSQDKMKLS